MFSPRTLIAAACLALVVALALALPGAGFGEQVAYAQAGDADYVDVALFLAVPTDDDDGFQYLDIVVVNQGTRTAYEVEVVVDVAVVKSVVRESHFLRLRDTPVGSTSLDTSPDGTDDARLRWTIPTLRGGQRAEVKARVLNKAVPPDPAFDNNKHVHVYSGEVTTPSYESNLRKGNNTDRVWSYAEGFRFDYRAQGQAGGNYTVGVSVDNISPSPGGTVNFTVTADRAKLVRRGITLRTPPIDTEVKIELTGGLSCTTDPPCTPSYSPIANRPASVSYDRVKGVFNIGTLDPDQYGEVPPNIQPYAVTLPLTVGNGALNEQCLTATLTGDPPPGTGPIDDDISDNVAKLCLGTPTTIPLRTGTVSVWTHYPCVGITTAPCDSGNDVRVRATAPDHNGVILDSGTAVFHIPDTPSRAYDSSSGGVNNGNTVSWQTSCYAGTASCTGFNPDREEFGVKLVWNTMPFNTPWYSPGPPATGGPWVGIAANGRARGLAVGTNPPGKMQIISDGHFRLFPLSQTNNWSVTFPTGGATVALTALSNYFAEFERLGTYVFDYTLRAKHSTLTGDCATGIAAFDNDANSFCATETYIFHVGPMADLEVRDGGASDRVAAGRKALTIVAVNKGPDHAPRARVTGLPTGAEVIYVSQGSYDAGTGVWNIGEMRLKDYYDSGGEPEPTLVLGASADADVTIENTVNYTVCIDSNGRTLKQHTNKMDCKDDSATTNVWYAAVCVNTGSTPDKVNTNTTHNTSAKCAAMANHSWQTEVCASSGSTGNVRDGRTETECHGWFEGGKYDLRVSNDSLTIKAREGIAGGGVGAPRLGLNTRTRATSLSWSEVKAVNTVPVTKYEVEWSPNGSSGWQRLTDQDGLNLQRNLLKYIDVDIETDVTRYYRVRAVNGAGVAGPWSRPAAVNAPSTENVLGLLATAGYGEVRLRWEKKAGATYYEVQWEIGNQESEWLNVGDVNEYTVQGLASARHLFRVRAVSATVPDPAAEVTATPLPAAPANLEARAGDGRVALTWTGVAGATGYEYRQDGGAWQSAGSVSAYTVAGLANGRTYRFEVRAVNGGLKGGVASVSARPVAGAVPPEPSREPGAPAWLVAQAAYGQYGGEVTLTWDAVPNAEGYVCEERDPDDANEPNGGWSDINFTPHHCPTSNTSITIDAYPQTSYDYRVRAYRTVDNVLYYGGWQYASIHHSDWPSPFQGR